MTKQAMLEIKGLKKGFGDKEVLKGLDLIVPENSIFGFVGKNGAGKTTTMKIIMSLLEADAGEVKVAGEKVSYGNSATSRHIGYLPDVPAFYGHLNCHEYLNLCGELIGMSSREIKERSAKLLDLVGLDPEASKRRIKGFSRGMKQRLGIAQALLNSPKLLICDEPTSALDPIGRKEILEVLRTAKEYSTIIFSTHILSDVERICSDVAFLNNGVIQMQGKIAEIRKLRTSGEYKMEFKSRADMLILKEYFPTLSEEGVDTLIFKGKQEALAEVFQCLAEKLIVPNKIESMEQSLETVFLEVTKE